MQPNPLTSYSVRWPSSCGAPKAELVNTPGFADCFRASTRVSEIGSLDIDSRPISRKLTTSIADLHAIPWVLAWSQSWVMLPG